MTNFQFSFELLFFKMSGIKHTLNDVRNSYNVKEKEDMM